MLQIFKMYNNYKLIKKFEKNNNNEIPSNKIEKSNNTCKNNDNKYRRCLNLYSIGCSNSKRNCKKGN